MILLTNRDVYPKDTNMKKNKDVIYLIDNRSKDSVVNNFPKAPAVNKYQSLHPQVMGIFFVDRNKEDNGKDNYVIRTIISSDKVQKSWGIRKWGVEKAVEEAINFRANFIGAELPPKEIVDELIATVKKWIKLSVCK